VSRARGRDVVGSIAHSRAQRRRRARIWYCCCALQLLTAPVALLPRTFAQNFGNTPLHKAAGRGHVELVQLLVQHGADTGAKNNVRPALSLIAASHACATLPRAPGLSAAWLPLLGRAQYDKTPMDEAKDDETLAALQPSDLLD
jgi:hypothetical protein